MNDERLFAVNLLWVHDPDLFAEYQEQSKPVLAKHGVHVERWLMTETMEGNGFDRPDQMVVTWHRNAAARDAFENDPEYREAAKIRDRAAKLVIVTGRSVYGD